MAIERVDFPIKNGDFPINHGDFPIKNGDFPIQNGEFPWQNVSSPEGKPIPGASAQTFQRPVLFGSVEWEEK